MIKNQFLNELHEMAANLQQQLEAQQIGFDPKKTGIRRQRIFNGDFEYFAYNYFPHHIWGQPSKFQKHFCQRIPNLLKQQHGCIEWWIAPRGEGKTSLLTKITPIWVIIQALQKPLVLIDYIIIIGAEMTMPAKIIEVIKSELCFNNMLKIDFPEITGKGILWRIGEIITKNNIKIEGFGADQAIRGTFHGSSRPQLILGDDLITDREARSPTERNNRWNWFNQAIRYLGPPDGTVKSINVATVLNSDDPVSRAKSNSTIGHTVHHFKALEQLPTRMDLWEQCESLMRNQDQGNQHPSPSYLFYQKHRTEMEKGAKNSWPSVRSLYDLMRSRADNPKSFSSEMQGEARNLEQQIFHTYKFWVHENSHWRYYGACDPSMGYSEKHHPSAIIIGGWDIKNKQLHIIEATIKRRYPSKLESDLIQYQKKYQMAAIAFENNNAYEYMRKSLMENASSNGIILPLIGITASVPMDVRIDSLEPYITGLNPTILFHSTLTQLLNELETWPEKQSHHHYDGLSALHLLYSLVISRHTELSRIKTALKRNIYNGYAP